MVRSKKDLIIEYVLISFGSIIMATSVSLMLMPNELSTGGFSGIALIIYYFLKIKAGTAILILNIPFLIIAYLKLGKSFIIKTIYGTAMLAIFVNILETIPSITNDRVLSCVYGGILSGIGTALVLRGGGSTGGSDLISYIVKEYRPQVSTSKAILLFDFFVVFLNVIFFKQIEIGLYSAIAIYLMGKMIDIIFEGTNFAKALFIVSSKYQEIAHEIGKELKRGSTGIYSKGMYTNEEKTVLLCVGSRNEAYHMQSIARKVDKGAFIIIINAREVIGKGFK